MGREDSYSLEERSKGGTPTTKSNQQNEKDGLERSDMTRSQKILLFFVLAVVLCIAFTSGLLVHFLAPPNLHPDHHNGSTQTAEEVTTAQPQIGCSDQCLFTLVESIPESLHYQDDEQPHPSTGPTILDLIQSAEQTISVASFYWTLQKNDTTPMDPSSRQGQAVFEALYDIGSQGQVKIQIVQNQPSAEYPDVDTERLAAAGADVRSINFTRLVGGGILHTKMWLVDKQHFFVGSANMDWRSYTQVKELGVLVQNCSCLADDMEKIFQIYWKLALQNATVPASWSRDFSPAFKKGNPDVVDTGAVYLSSSPPSFCPEGRTTDLDAILDVISKARDFIYIAVMDYMPFIQLDAYNRYWPVLNDALKTAAYDHNVTVYLLASRWQHSNPDMFLYLRSLEMFGQSVQTRVDLEVRLFEFPASPDQNQVPYTRVNHNKYMVTDQHAYIGTSNWSGEYFVYTAGIGFIMEQPQTDNDTMSLRHQLENVFLRDWNSNYSHPLSYSTN
ncbi:5'-3' exonuclease PLD3-like [Haliotis cracherodii]|uniref:5'-3' exonuclease PLD3-like n=1 Tax=Haliotis cracherodii TaxID=6455 RepID=UPI0039E98095